VGSTVTRGRAGANAADNATTGAAGGAAIAADGTTYYSGGSGGPGDNTDAGSSPSGGGGGGAGSAGAGGNAGAPTAGAAGSGGGGAGGTGVLSFSSGGGNAGTAPGGGGSGAKAGIGTQTGGAGARGQIVITYTPPLPNAPTISAPVAAYARKPGATIDLTATATEPTGQQVLYRWKYNAGAGDQTIGDTGLVNSGVAATYEWDTTGLALGTYVLKCWSVDSDGDVSAAYAEVTIYLADAVITSPTDLSSHISGTVDVIAKGYLAAAGNLSLQIEIDTANPPSSANDDYDLIQSGLVAQDTSTTVTANVSHLGTWYLRARTLDTSDATSDWTAVLTIYVLEALLLDSGSQVEQSILAVANKVYVLAAKSAPAVTATATNTVVSPTYAESPREIFVAAPEGADATACAAIAFAQLAIRSAERTNINGLKVRLEDGLKLQRGDLVGVQIDRMNINGTYPIREMRFDVANDICEIDVGDFWEPRTDQDALVAIAQKLQSLTKETAQ